MTCSIWAVTIDALMLHCGLWPHLNPPFLMWILASQHSLSFLLLLFSACSWRSFSLSLSLSFSPLVFLLYHCRQKLAVWKVLKGVSLPASSEFKGKWVPNTDLVKAFTQGPEIWYSFENLVKSKLADNGLSWVLFLHLKYIFWWGFYKYTHWWLEIRRYMSGCHTPIFCKENHCSFLTGSLSQSSKYPDSCLQLLLLNSAGNPFCPKELLVSIAPGNVQRC